VTYESGEFSVSRIRAKLSIKPAFFATHAAKNYVKENMVKISHQLIDFME